MARLLRALGNLLEDVLRQRFKDSSIRFGMGVRSTLAIALTLNQRNYREFYMSGIENMFWLVVHGFAHQRLLELWDLCAMDYSTSNPEAQSMGSVR